MTQALLELFNQVCWTIGLIAILIAAAWPFVHRR